MFTRNMYLGQVYTEALPGLREYVAKSARKGTVNVYFHEDQPVREVPLAHLTVDVWSENEGSVNDFCDFYLAQLVGHAHELWRVIDASTAYSLRVNAWLRSEKNKRG